MCCVFGTILAKTCIYACCGVEFALCIAAKGLVVIQQRVTRPDTDVVLVLPGDLIGSQT